MCLLNCLLWSPLKCYHCSPPSVTLDIATSTLTFIILTIDCVLVIEGQSVADTETLLHHLSYGHSINYTLSSMDQCLHVCETCERWKVNWPINFTVHKIISHTTLCLNCFYTTGD